MLLSADRFFQLSPEQCTPEQERKFFSSLKMRNGTFKTTKSMRFAEIEGLLAPILKPRAASLKMILDVAASSGTTTIELSDFLTRLGAVANVVATDLYADGYVMRLGRGLGVLTDSSGFPLQYIFAGRPVRSWIRRLDYVTLTAWPRKFALRRVAQKSKSIIGRGEAFPVRLVTRQLEKREDIEFVEDDLMKQSPRLQHRFDLVRAANILNMDYFKEADLRHALVNIRGYLRGPGALLLVNRTEEKTDLNNGSLFELQPNGSFQEILRIGNGTEISALVRTI
jgi:hypothetical protein